MQFLPECRLRVLRFLARPQHFLSGRITPSGRFTLGTVPKSPPNAKRSGVVQDAKEELLSVPSEDRVETGDQWEQLSMLQSVPEQAVGLAEEPSEAEALIGLSESTISHKRAKRGCRGISSAASAQLMYWLSQMEVRYGRENLSFLTLTIPSIWEGDRKRVQDNWSEIVRRYIQELKRELVRRGAKHTHVLGCTEIQIERAQKEGWDVPHLHLVFVGKLRPKGGWIFDPPEVRGLWQRVVSSFLSRPNVSFGSSENIQRVKESVSRYLGKYLSKSKSKDRALIDSSDWFPSDYCVIPARLRSWYRGRTVSGFSVAEYILAVMKEAERIPGFWMRPITIRTSIGDQVIGWAGCNPDWIMDAPMDIWKDTGTG